MDDQMLKRDCRAGFVHFLSPLSLLLPLSSLSKGSVDRGTGSFPFHRRNLVPFLAMEPSIINSSKFPIQHGFCGGLLEIMNERKGYNYLTSQDSNCLWLSSLGTKCLRFWTAIQKRERDSSHVDPVNRERQTERKLSEWRSLNVDETKTSGTSEILSCIFLYKKKRSKNKI